MKQETAIRLQNAIYMLDYMAAEVKHNISKYIASNGYMDKYAIKHSVNPNMTVEFFFLNTSNNTMASKTYTYERFCEICSGVETLERTFIKLADDFMSAVDKETSEVVVIKDSLIEFI